MYRILPRPQRISIVTFFGPVSPRRPLPSSASRLCILPVPSSGGNSIYRIAFGTVSTSYKSVSVVVLGWQEYEERVRMYISRPHMQVNLPSPGRSRSEGCRRKPCRPSPLCAAPSGCNIVRFCVSRPESPPEWLSAPVHVHSRFQPPTVKSTG